MCRTPEATRTTTMAARAWLPLSVLLLFQLAVAADKRRGVVNNVGGFHDWGNFPTGFSFQKWSDSIDWYSGDVLVFRYDYSSHNVWEFKNQPSFETCNFSGLNLLGTDNLSETTLFPASRGFFSTRYFGSSRGADCFHGMAFSVTYLTDCGVAGCPRSPPPPPTWTSESQKVPVVAIALPIVLVLVLGACTLVFCCVRKAKRQAQAAATPPKVPPQSPLPTDDPTPVPNGAPGPAREAATAGGSSIRALGL